MIKNTKWLTNWDTAKCFLAEFNSENRQIEKDAKYL